MSPTPEKAATTGKHRPNPIIRYPLKFLGLYESSEDVLTQALDPRSIKRPNIFAGRTPIIRAASNRQIQRPARIFSQPLTPLAIFFSLGRLNADVTIDSQEDYQLTGHSLIWTVPQVSSSASTTSGQLEFSVSGVAGSEPNGFFPIKVNFNAVGSLGEVGIREVLNPDDRVVAFSQDRLVEVSEFTIG